MLLTAIKMEYKREVIEDFKMVCFLMQCEQCVKALNHEYEAFKYLKFFSKAMSLPRSVSKLKGS